MCWVYESNSYISEWLNVFPFKEKTLIFKILTLRKNFILLNFANMRLTRCVQQLRFNIAKHFTANPDVQAYTMEDLGHKVNSFYKGFWNCTKKTWRLLDRQGDKRFGYSTTFKLLDDEAVAYIRGLTENQEFVSKESQNSKSSRNKKNLTRYRAVLFKWEFIIQMRDAISAILGHRGMVF